MRALSKHLSFHSNLKVTNLRKAHLPMNEEARAGGEGGAPHSTDQQPRNRNQDKPVDAVRFSR